MEVEGDLGKSERSRCSGRWTARRQAHVDQLAGYEQGPGATQRATESAVARAEGAHTIVLVEGISDQIAVETLAERLGRRLVDEGVVVFPMGGAHAVKQFVPQFALTEGVTLRGLVDQGEAVHFARALVDAGMIKERDGVQVLERHGFLVCEADLEDELIRSLDQPNIESLLGTEGDLGAFRSLQKQPAWRDHRFEAQMHRWLRSVALRSSRYAQLFLLAADIDRIPRPLLDLVNRIPGR